MDGWKELNFIISISCIFRKISMHMIYPSDRFEWNLQTSFSKSFTLQLRKTFLSVNLYQKLKVIHTFGKVVNCKKKYCYSWKQKSLWYSNLKSMRLPYPFDLWSYAKISFETICNISHEIVRKQIKTQVWGTIKVHRCY